MALVKQSSAIIGLGEIALCVNDLEKMREFYENVIGLEVMKRFPNAMFFRVAAGAAGHAQAFVLFDRSKKTNGPAIHRATPEGVSHERSTLDHVAFEIDLASYKTEKVRLEQHVERRS